MDLATRYTDQIIRSLTRFDGVDDFVNVDLGASASPFKRIVGKRLLTFFKSRGLEIVKSVKFDREARLLGADWPVHADTMIGIKRLENIRDCVKRVIHDGILGDFVETGVWRGGGSIMMRACLEAFGDKTRKVWCADSFEGLPPPDLDRYPQDAGMIWHTQSQLAISLEQVQRNFEKYGYLDDRVVFLRGWFKDTLPSAPIERIAILRLDGDLYASTMDAFNSLYAKVSPGGFIIVDDYGMEENTCRKAVSDFRAAENISSPIQKIDNFGVFWRKDQ
jgi:O-methyltransferase